MIRYFRINDPYRLVGLFILLLIIYIPLFIYDNQLTIPELKNLLVGEKQNEGYSMYLEVVDNNAPLAAWTHEILDSLFGRSILVRHILAFVIILLQSAYVGILFISKKVFSENTYIPSFLFSLLFFFSYDTLSLSNELLGSGFLLLALNNLFQEIEFRNQRDESIFNVGLCISLASLFAFSFIVYLLGAVVILLLFTRSNVRKFLLLIFGFLLPHLLTISIAFLGDSTAELWEYFYLSNLSFERVEFVSAKTLLTLSALPLAYFVVSLVILNREARFSKYQSQILQTILLWLTFSMVFIFYTKDLRPQSLIVFIPGLSFLFTHFFLLIRRKKFVQMNAWILFVGIVSIAYLARFEKIKSVDYRDLWVKQEATELRGKRILVLDNTLDLYHRNFLATPFLNWNLSQNIFRNPDYYENVTQVYHSFKTDPPDLVIDKENLLENFFNRMPEIKSGYLRQGDHYIRRVNN
ncbi:MAG: DUF6427 family protein [Cyclobacteriaceae bacterium]